MGWVSIAAVYFVVWWLVLFAVLPFGLKTQDDDDSVTLGTVSSAPKGAHMLRAALWTTLVSALLVGGFFALTRGLGYGFSDIPRIVPDFGQDASPNASQNASPNTGPNTGVDVSKDASSAGQP